MVPPDLCRPTDAKHGSSVAHIGKIVNAVTSW